MMAAGVDAAGDLDLEVADLVLAFQVAEALGDALGDGDGSRVGEVAVVEPGAGDDVGEKPGVGRADRKSTRLTPVTNAHLVCRLLLEKIKLTLSIKYPITTHNRILNTLYT